MWQSMEILKVFNQYFKTNFLKKTQTYEKLEYRFQLKALRLKAQDFYKKLLCQKPMLR